MTAQALLASIFCFVVHLFGFCNSVPTLLIEPSNMTIPMGENARFRCRIDSVSDVSVNWIRVDKIRGDSNIISNDRVVYNIVEVDRYSVIGDMEIDKDLQIIDIKPYDEAGFKCQAIENEGTGSVISRTAYLTVQYPPDDRVTCRLIGSNRFKVGDLLEAFCVILTDPGVPPAELQWVNMDGTNVTSAFKDPEYDLRNAVLTFNRTISVEDNGKTFTCLIRHPLLTTSVGCTVGPIEVRHAPLNASITPSPYAVAYMEGDDIEFKCSANANPKEGVFFIWSTKPRFKGKLTYTDDQRSRIKFTKVPFGLNGTTLICNATNQYGFSTDTFIIYILKDDTHTSSVQPTKAPIQLPTSAPVNFPNTYIIVFILMGVIFLLLIGIVAILVIGRKWREPVIVLDVNDEVCRRSLSGGGSLVFGSGSHSIVLHHHHTQNGEPHLFEVHKSKKDGYSIASSASCCSHHSNISEARQNREDFYPSDPQKAAKIEGTEFHRSAHINSRHNSVDSACSDGSHYERSICSSTNNSRPGTPKRSQDPLPPTPGELIPMVALNASDLATLEDEEHHAEKNYYMNSPKRRSSGRDAESRGNESPSQKRDSDDHKYEDLTPVTKRKLYGQDLDTGEEDFPDDDKPRVTPEQQFGELEKDDLLK